MGLVKFCFSWLLLVSDLTLPTAEAGGFSLQRPLPDLRQVLHGLRERLDCRVPHGQYAQTFALEIRRA